MTLPRRLSSGLFAIALLTIATAEHTQGAGYQLYEQMHTLTNQQVALQDVSDDVITYVARIAKQEGPANAFITEDLVRLALEAKIDKFCQSYGNIDTCQQVYDQIRDWARDAIDTRALTTDLLLIATGHETGVSGRMGEIFTVPEHLLNIRHIWLSADDRLMTTEALPGIRAAPRPDALTASDFDQLGQALADAGSDAVWRYRYGASAFLDSDEYCRNGAGDPELFDFIARRWCTVEEKLKAIRQKLPESGDSFDPPLKRGEIAIFPLRKLDTPPHVIVWMMAEKTGTGEIIERDVGVGWDLSLTPSLPGMLRSSPLDPCSMTVGVDAFCKVAENFWIRPGGLYADPPAAEDFGGGLCRLPFARDGYLCRPQRSDRCDREIAGKAPRSIVLTECKPSQAKQPTAFTESGPDTCSTGWWRTPTSNSSDPSLRDTAGKDESLRLDACSVCVVDIQCGSCPAGLSEAQTKNEYGVIPICLSTDAPPPSLRYVLLHELTHAKQFCGLPIGKRREEVIPNAEKCCALEQEAYRVSCKAMADDGLLEEAHLSIEECAGALANMSCNGFGATVCSPLRWEIVNSALTEVWRKYTGRAPSCADLVNNLSDQEPRAASLKEGLRNSCTPGCQTKYENSIGGNLCYVGQCIEQSVEQARIIPGRMPFTVQDEAFPWDACALKDPRNGALVALSALSPPLPPPYNPRLLVESLDRALCQLNGLPTSIPSILCQFDYTRRIAIPAENPLATALSFGNQTTEQEDPTASLQRMTQGIGTRIGTGLLERYLLWSGRSLAEILRTGNQLIKTMEKTKFTLTACPRNAAEEPGFCAASGSPSE